MPLDNSFLRSSENAVKVRIRLKVADSETPTIIAEAVGGEIAVFNSKDHPVLGYMYRDKPYVATAVIVISDDQKEMVKRLTHEDQDVHSIEFVD